MLDKIVDLKNCKFNLWYLKERLMWVAQCFDSILPSFSRDLFSNFHTENINKIVQCPLFKGILMVQLKRVYD